MIGRRIPSPQKVMEQKIPAKFESSIKQNDTKCMKIWKSCAKKQKQKTFLLGYSFFLSFSFYHLDETESMESSHASEEQDACDLLKSDHFGNMNPEEEIK